MDRPVADTDPRPLLDDDEPTPYEIVNSDGRSRVILTCDHASRRIPRRLGTLGVAPADRWRRQREMPGSKPSTGLITTQ